MDHPQPARTHNAQNPELLRGLERALLDTRDRRADVRVVVLAGAGRSFSSGHDLKAAASDPEYRRNLETVEGRLWQEAELFVRPVELLRSLPLPTVCRVQGHCMAAALMLACATDLVVAAEDAQFSSWVTRDQGAADVEVPTLAWDLAPRQAKQLLWLSEGLDAEAALRCGLVNWVVPGERLDAKVEEVAAELARVPREALALSKLSFDFAERRRGRDEAAAYHFLAHQLSHNTEESKRLLAARVVELEAKLANAAEPSFIISVVAKPKAETAVRVAVSGRVQGVGFRLAVVERAREAGLMGWVRNSEDGRLLVHAEGPAAAVASLRELLATGPPGARVEAVEAEEVKPEGHEQFAVRGVSAGAFVVQEHAATAHHFDLRLEVDGAMRSWAVPKGPSLDPAAKRLALEVEDHALEHNEFEGELGEGGVIVWDRGHYEQGGRVPWPEALERGHAVFVLHGEKLRGGFALQRTGRGAKPQWLLIKRRDEEARPGSDVVAEQPRSVLSGRSLGELLEEAR